MKLFEVEKVASHINRIKTPFGVSVYLVVGSEKALLIDTGMGIGDLKGYVESLIDVPYEVILTHGHCDHAGGSVQFDSVWLNPLDDALEKTHNTLEHRIEDVFSAPFGVPEGISKGDFLPQRMTGYLPLEVGSRFDLGDECVSIWALPGHTHGCVVPLVEKDRCAIFGDAIGEGTLLHFPESTSIEEYLEALLAFKKIEDKFDRVLRFHGSGESKKKILGDMIDLCKDIMEGKDARIPVVQLGFKGCFGRTKEHPGYEGNLIYNPERIRKNKKKLLIRADDLGFSEAVNVGIERTLKAGLVQSVGLMPNMPWAKDGVERVANYQVSLGQHTNICVGKPICNPEDIPSLVNELGEFKSSSEYRKAFEEGYDIVDLADACKEVEAQYFRFKELTGKEPAYFEAHAIASENLWKALAIVAKKYDLPLNDMRPSEREGNFRGKEVAPCEMKSMREDYDPVECLKEAVAKGSEVLPNVFVTHPGYLDDYLLNHSSLTINRTKEVAMLCSEEIKEWLNNQNVILISYDDIL